jgi:hypothetical protein
MIKRFSKIEYKQKAIAFKDGHLEDEDGNIIDLVNDLKTVFGATEFSISASKGSNDNLDIDDFEPPKDIADDRENDENFF